MADNLGYTPGVGANIATKDVSSVHYQRILRQAIKNGVPTDFLDCGTRQDVFTVTGAGTTIDVSSQGASKFSLQVKKLGSVTSWTVVLEASLDNVNFVTILTHTDVTSGDGAIEFSGANLFPALYFRARCTALTLGTGTNITATILGMP